MRTLRRATRCSKGNGFSVLVFEVLNSKGESTKENVMNISNKSVLITGANRGIGRALLDEALRRGAKKVYAGTRGALQHPDERVTPLTLDVTNGSQIQRAVDEVDTLDVLINNAAIVNNLSLAGLAPLPIIPSYSASKAAALNLTQSLRALLAGQGVTVHAVVLGPVDTDMNRGFNIPKVSTESAAVGIFDGLEKGEEEIFPDPTSRSIAEGWRAGVSKALERQFAAFVPQRSASA